MTAFVSELESLLNRHSIDDSCGVPDYLLAERVVEFIEEYRVTIKTKNSGLETESRLQGLLAVLKSVGLTRFRLSKLHLKIDGYIIQCTMYYNAIDHVLTITKDSKPMNSSGHSNCSYVEDRLIPSTELINAMDSAYPGFGWRSLPIRFE